LLYGRPLPAARGPWRPGDQRAFIADTAGISRDLGWKPQMGVATGLSLLVQWVQQSVHEIEDIVDAGLLA